MFHRHMWLYRTLNACKIRAVTRLLTRIFITLAEFLQLFKIFYEWTENGCRHYNHKVAFNTQEYIYIIMAWFKILAIDIIYFYVRGMIMYVFASLKLLNQYLLYSVSQPQNHRKPSWRENYIFLLMQMFSVHCNVILFSLVS